jgi:hypothetical protein
MQEYQDTPLYFQTRVVLMASFEVDRPLKDHLLGEAEACCRHAPQQTRNFFPSEYQERLPTATIEMLG